MNTIGQLCASQSRGHWVALGSEDAATAPKCKGRFAQGENTKDISWGSPSAWSWGRVLAGSTVILQPPDRPHQGACGCSGHPEPPVRDSAPDPWPPPDRSHSVCTMPRRVLTREATRPHSCVLPGEPLRSTLTAPRPWSLPHPHTPGEEAAGLQ